MTGHLRDIGSLAAGLAPFVFWAIVGLIVLWFTVAEKLKKHRVLLTVHHPEGPAKLERVMSQAEIDRRRRSGETIEIVGRAQR